MTPEWVLDASNWKRLAGFARIVPDGDVLPLRAKYRGNCWQIGVNYVHASSDDPKDGLWYAWPDLVASVLLTGKVPRDRGGLSNRADRQSQRLEEVSFRGQVPIDPRSQDFFKPVIEERARLAGAPISATPSAIGCRRSLKTLGTATSYGNFRPDGSPRERQGSRAHVLRHRSGTVSVQGASIPKHRANTASRRWLHSLPAVAICCSHSWRDWSPIAVGRTRWKTPTPWRL